MAHQPPIIQAPSPQWLVMLMASPVLIASGHAEMMYCSVNNTPTPNPRFLCCPCSTWAVLPLNTMCPKLKKRLIKLSKHTYIVTVWYIRPKSVLVYRWNARDVIAQRKSAHFPCHPSCHGRVVIPLGSPKYVSILH